MTRQEVVKIVGEFLKEEGYVPLIGNLSVGVHLPGDYSIGIWVSSKGRVEVTVSKLGQFRVDSRTNLSDPDCFEHILEVIREYEKLSI